MAETAKDASRHPAPDAPERIDHRRRCTRHDHRTCCRGSRGSASLPCHTLRKRVENVPRRIAPTAHFERNDVTIICETVHQGFFAEMLSIRPRSGSNPRLLSLTNVNFWTAAFGCGSATGLGSLRSSSANLEQSNPEKRWCCGVLPSNRDFPTCLNENLVTPLTGSYSAA